MRLRLKNIFGREINKNVGKYVIDWNAKCKSKLQFNAKQFFKDHWEYHICFEEFPVYGTRLKVDLLNATKKIAVEVNGPQHTEFVKFFHENPANYLKSIKRDWQKTEWLESNDYTLIEIEKADLNQLSVDYILEKYEINI